MPDSQDGNRFRRKKPGRRSKLDADVNTIICSLLADGVTIGVACQASGITYSTYYDWMERGRRQIALVESGAEPDPDEEKFMRFVESTATAEAQGTESLLHKIIDAASDDWRAAAWLLARRNPREFAMKVKELEAIMEMDDERARQIIDSVAVTSNNGNKALTNGHS